jgi:Methyltransferase FkbM domain
MRRLDDVLAEMPGREFDLLKVDVQGAEIDVLRGGVRTLAGIVAIVIELSLLEYNKGAPLIGEVMRWLAEQGFALFDVFPVSRIPAGALLQVDRIFLRRGSSLWPRAPSSEPPAKGMKSLAGRLHACHSRPNQPTVCSVGWLDEGVRCPRHGRTTRCAPRARIANSGSWPSRSGC